MIVYLVLNQQKAEARRVAEQAAGILEQCGAQAIWPDSDPERDSALLAKANAVLTIGGDGTILHTARRTRLHGIPILGINLGRVGFLATCEIEEMPVKLARLARGDFQLDRGYLPGSVSGFLVHLFRRAAHYGDRRFHGAWTDQRAGDFGQPDFLPDRFPESRGRDRFSAQRE